MQTGIMTLAYAGIGCPSGALEGSLWELMFSATLPSRWISVRNWQCPEGSLLQRMTIPWLQHFPTHPELCGVWVAQTKLGLWQSWPTNLGEICKAPLKDKSIDAFLDLHLGMWLCGGPEVWLRVTTWAENLQDVLSLWAVVFQPCVQRHHLARFPLTAPIST